MAEPSHPPTPQQQTPAAPTAGSHWVRVGWLAVAALWVLAGAGYFVAGSALVFEPPVYLTLLMVVLSRPGMRRVVAQAGPVRTGTFVVLVAVLVAGHLHDNSRTIYPLAHWTMYGNARPVSLVYHELVAVAPDRSERSLRPWQSAGENYARGLYRRLSRQDRESPDWQAVVARLVEADGFDPRSAQLEWRVWSVDPAVRPVGSQRELTDMVVLRPLETEAESAP